MAIKLDAQGIINLIGTVIPLVGTVSALVEQAQDVLGSDDMEKVKAALTEMQAANDALFSKVSDKLKDAASKT